MPDVPFYLLIPAAWPYVISSRFNAPRSYPFAPKRLQLHEGIDFAPTKGAPANPLVRASQRGIVDKVGWDGKGYRSVSASTRRCASLEEPELALRCMEKIWMVSWDESI